MGGAFRVSPHDADLSRLLSPCELPDIGSQAPDPGPRPNRGQGPRGPEPGPRCRCEGSKTTWRSADPLKQHGFRVVRPRDAPEGPLPEKTLMLMLTLCGPGNRPCVGCEL